MPSNKMYSEFEHNHVIQTFAKAMCHPSNTTKRPGGKQTRKLFVESWQTDLDNGVPIIERSFDGIIRKFYYEPGLWDKVVEATNKIAQERNELDQSSALNLLLLKSSSSSSHGVPPQQQSECTESDSSDEEFEQIVTSPRSPASDLDYIPQSQSRNRTSSTTVKSTKSTNSIESVKSVKSVNKKNKRKMSVIELPGQVQSEAINNTQSIANIQSDENSTNNSSACATYTTQNENQAGTNTTVDDDDVVVLEAVCTCCGVDSVVNKCQTTNCDIGICCSCMQVNNIHKKRFVCMLHNGPRYRHKVRNCRGQFQVTTSSTASTENQSVGSTHNTTKSNSNSVQVFSSLTNDNAMQTKSKKVKTSHKQSQPVEEKPVEIEKQIIFEEPAVVEDQIMIEEEPVVIEKQAVIDDQDDQVVINKSIEVQNKIVAPEEHDVIDDVVYKDEIASQDEIVIKVNASSNQDNNDRIPKVCDQDAQKAEMFALKKMLLIISDNSDDGHVDSLNHSFQSLPKKSQQASLEIMSVFLKNQFLSK